MVLSIGIEGLVFSSLGAMQKVERAEETNLLRACFQLPFTNAFYLGNRRYNTSGGLRRRAILDLQGFPLLSVMPTGSFDS